MSIGLILIILFIGVYCLIGMAAMSVFPTMDGSLAGVKLGFTIVYGATLVMWLAGAGGGFLRISKYVDKPAVQRIGMIRLVAGFGPLILVGAAVVYLINREPVLLIDIISPKTAEELIAPVEVTYSTDTANRIFTQQNLKPLKYEWDFDGDGVIDQETFDPQPTYRYLKAGVYNVTVRVTMESGKTKKLVQRLVITKSSFGLNPDPPVVDEPVTFSLENLFERPEDLVKADWDYDGDGTVDESKEAVLTATFTYHSLGIVKPAVTVTYTNKTQSTLTRTVQVSPEPAQPFPVSLSTEPANLLGPVPFPAVFVLTTEAQISRVSWNFGDGKTAEGLRVAHVFNEVGDFTVTAVVQSASGSLARLRKNVTVANVLELPDLTFSGTPEVANQAVQGAAPLTVDITPSTDQPLISFSWEAPKADEFKVNDTTAHAVYRSPGKYTLELVATDTEQKAMRRRIEVNVTASTTVPDFTMTPSSPIAPATVAFDATDTYVGPGEEITGFIWDFGDNGSFTRTDQQKFADARITHRYDKPGTYKVTLTVQTTTGKNYDAEKTLVVRQPVSNLCFMPTRTSCPDAPCTIRFDDCSTGQFTNYLWKFGDGDESDQKAPVTHVFIDKGDYEVNVTATDSQGDTVGTESPFIIHAGTSDSSAADESSVSDTSSDTSSSADESTDASSSADVPVQ